MQKLKNGDIFVKSFISVTREDISEHPFVVLGIDSNHTVYACELTSIKETENSFEYNTNFKLVPRDGVARESYAMLRNIYMFNEEYVTETKGKLTQRCFDSLYDYYSRMDSFGQVRYEDVNLYYSESSEIENDISIFDPDVEESIEDIIDPLYLDLYEIN